MDYNSKTRQTKLYFSTSLSASRSKRHLWIVLAALTILTAANMSPTYAKELKDKNIYLSIGDSTTVRLNELGGLRLSRKGIVIAKPIDKGIWNLIAHKTGFVIATSDIDGQQRYLISVSKKKRTSRTATEGNTTHCRLAALKYSPCRYKNNILTGLFSDFREFWRENHLCNSSKKCTFLGRLSRTGIKSIQKKSKEIFGDNISLSIDSRGTGIIRVSCGILSKKLITPIVKQQLFSGSPFHGISVVCRQELNPRNYTLKAKVILVTDSDAREIGFSNTTSLSLAHDMAQPIPISVSKLHALIKSKKITIIAEPALHLLEGAQSSARSGGEYQVLDEANSSKTSGSVRWKQHGVNLSAKIESLGDQISMLTYKFSLKSPTGSNRSKSLQLNEFSSKIRVVNDTPTIVGGINFISSGSSDQATPILANIPIIGLLFKILSQQKASTKLFLWFSVERDLLKKRGEIAKM